MLADQEHPLEDAIAEADAGETPDPQVVVVYRTRGIPWLLLPPLLLVAGVAAIVVYRKSTTPDHAALVALRESSTRHVAARVAASDPGSDDRIRIDALSELTAATGRPISATTSTPEIPRYTRTPPVDAPEPGPAPASPAPAPEAVAPKDVPTPAEPPKPAPLPPPALAAPAPANGEAAGPRPVPELLSRPTAPAVEEPFDPLVTAPPTEPPARRDRVGFDPDARPATLDDEEPRAVAPPHGAAPLAPPAADPAPGPLAPPAPEQPFELDRRIPAAGAEAARAERTRDALEEMQAEAERRLAEQVHLRELMPALLRPDPAEARKRIGEYKVAVRRLAAHLRPEFHEELKRLIREQGLAAGVDIKAARDRFGIDTLPEIAQPAFRDLITVAPRLSTGQRIRRMRQWGLPETMILDDLHEREIRKIGVPGEAHVPGAARNEDEAWVYAAWALLHYPPGSPRADSQPAPGP